MIVIKRRGDQPLLVTGSKDGSVKLWESSTLVCRKHIQENLPICAICYMPEKDYLILGIQALNKGGKMCVYKLDKGVKHKELSENNSAVTEILWDSVHMELYSGHINCCVEYNKI